MSQLSSSIDTMYNKYVCNSCYTIDDTNEDQLKSIKCLKCNKKCCILCFITNIENNNTIKCQFCNKEYSLYNIIKYVDLDTYNKYYKHKFFDTIFEKEKDNISYYSKNKEIYDKLSACKSKLDKYRLKTINKISAALINNSIDNIGVRINIDNKHMFNALYYHLIISNKSYEKLSDQDLASFNILKNEILDNIDEIEKLKKIHFIKNDQLYHNFSNNVINKQFGFDHAIYQISKMYKLYDNKASDLCLENIDKLAAMIDILNNKKPVAHSKLNLNTYSNLDFNFESAYIFNFKNDNNRYSYYTLKEIIYKLNDRYLLIHGNIEDKLSLLVTNSVIKSTMKKINDRFNRLFHIYLRLHLLKKNNKCVYDIYYTFINNKCDKDNFVNTILYNYYDPKSIYIDLFNDMIFEFYSVLYHITIYNTIDEIINIDLYAEYKIIEAKMCSILTVYKQYKYNDFIKINDKFMHNMQYLE